MSVFLVGIPKKTCESKQMIKKENCDKSQTNFLNHELIQNKIDMQSHGVNDTNTYYTDSILWTHQ